MGVLSPISSAIFGSPNQPNSQPFLDESQRLRQEGEEFRKREGADYANQAGIAQYLQQQATGAGPSVAGAQLAQGMDMAGRQQIAQAAGATGVNSALAQYGAAQNTAQLQSQVNAEAAVRKQQEQIAAQQQLAALYSNMGQRSAGLFGGTTGQSLDAGRIGVGVDQFNAQMDMQQQAALLNAVGGAGAAYFSRGK